MREKEEIQVSFHPWDSVDHADLKYAVIMARYEGKWIFVRHKERPTWEIPGGRREPGEPITGTARRELYEETGAIEFSLTPFRIYAVKRGREEASYGGLFFAEVTRLGPLPDSEIGETTLFGQLPEELTYPAIQPHLYAETLLFAGRPG